MAAIDTILSITLMLMNILLFLSVSPDGLKKSPVLHNACFQYYHGKIKGFPTPHDVIPDKPDTGSVCPSDDHVSVSKESCIYANKKYCFNELF